MMRASAKRKTITAISMPIRLKAMLTPRRGVHVRDRSSCLRPLHQPNLA